MAASPSADSARRLISEGRFTEAAEILEKHLMNRPDDRLARSLLAHAHFKNGSYPAAERQYRMLANQPNPNARDLYSLGSTLEALGELDEADGWYGKAAALDPHLTLATEARDRVAAKRAQSAVGKTGSPTTPSTTAPAGGKQGGQPFQELVIPPEEQLEEYIELKKQKEKREWWIQNWHRYPWPVRLFGILSILAVIALGVGISYGIYGLLTDDGTPSGVPSPSPSPQPSPAPTPIPQPTPEPPTPEPPTPSASLSTVSLDPSVVTGGDPSSGTVTLSAPAPSDGVVVSLSSSNGEVATVPSSVTVAAGTTQASFTVTTVASSEDAESSISASAGGVTKSVTLTVNKSPNANQ